MDEARNHARLAFESAPEDWDQLEILGSVLFELGEFKLAYGALVLASRSRSLKADTFRMLAALFRRNSEHENERRCIHAAASAETLVGPVNPTEGIPKIPSLAFRREKLLWNQD